MYLAHVRNRRINRHQCADWVMGTAAEVRKGPGARPCGLHRPYIAFWVSWWVLSEGLPYCSCLKSYHVEITRWRSEGGSKEMGGRLLQQSRKKMTVAWTKVSKWDREEVRAAKKLTWCADGLSDVGCERRRGFLLNNWKNEVVVDWDGEKWRGAGFGGEYPPPQILSC